MILLTLENLTKGYREKNLFENLTLGIEEGEKIGLIGVNGAGKTTLLQLIAGVDLPDRGNISRKSNLTVEYLPQNPEFNDQSTVLAQVLSGNSAGLAGSFALDLIRDYEQAVAQLNQAPDDAERQSKVLFLSQQMEERDAWQWENEAKTVLTKLGITDFTASVETLSGGQKKRVALARALLNPADLLILDEPTNHLDNAATDWLEQYLNKRKGAVIMVTHDRYFLDRVVTRILELDQARLFSYTGGYSKYLELKLERAELQQTAENKRQRLLQKELAWIRKGPRARTTKQKARINRFEDLQANQPEPVAKEMDLPVGASRLGKKVINIERVSHAFGGRELIKDFGYLVLRDDRVGIIGPNRAGKTTLLKLIAGQLQPDQGKIERGPTVKLGLFGQEKMEMDEGLRVIDYLKEVAEFLPAGNGIVISAAKMLERFLFPADLQWTPIARLSGGEKRRLYLLRVLMGAPNVLLLDEPTNDLDIPTLTVLEDYLDDFPGAVLTVSHDRYFLDRTVDRILAFEGNGVINSQVGNYSDYQHYFVQLSSPGLSSPNAKMPIERKAKAANTSNTADTGDTAKTAKTAKTRDQLKERPIKLTYNEQLEFGQIEEVITKVEQELRELDAVIDQAGSDYLRLQELVLSRPELEQRLEALLERWIYLSEKAEAAAKRDE